jgi:hypothetical protein
MNALSSEIKSAAGHSMRYQEASKQHRLTYARLRNKRKSFNARVKVIGEELCAWILASGIVAVIVELMLNL